MNLFGGNDEANHEELDQGHIFGHGGQAQPGQPALSQEQQGEPAPFQGQWPQPVSSEERQAQPSYGEDQRLANEEEPHERRSLLPRIGIGLLAGVVLIALGFVIARFLDNSDVDSAGTATQELPEVETGLETSSPDASDDPVEPVDSVPEEIVLAPVGLSCVIELAGQPSGAEFVIGEPPTDCPDLSVWHQYAEYPGGDLLPWTEGVEECWVSNQLVQMWIGFQISETEQGWLPLTPETDAGRFHEGFNDGELFATASAGSASVGSLNHAALTGRAFAIQLDLPEAIDPPTGDKTHLGGCWQSDRTNTLGLQFYWPAGVDV